MSNCFILPNNDCFPSTVSQVFDNLANCNAYTSQVVIANQNRYQNAFCPTNPFCFVPCTIPYDETDFCLFNNIYKKYSNICGYQSCCVGAYPSYSKR